MRHHLLSFGIVIFMTLLGASASAQPQQLIPGDYVGTLGSLHLKLHIKAAADGGLAGTMDSPDQGAIGLACAGFRLDGKNLAFTVPVVHGSWKGTVAADGSLAGTWDQGTPMPLTFTRDTFIPAAKPSPVDGIWLGSLQAGGKILRIQITVKSDASGKEFCSLDSLDQRAMGLACANVTLKKRDLAFDVPAVKGGWSGTLSADGKELTGTWTQGSPMSLNFARQKAALTAAAIPPPQYDDALPATGATGLQAVMAKDLAQALEQGELAPSTGAGVSIGVVQNGVRETFTFGAAKPDSIFEIGSITKTFTGLILAQMVTQGKVRFDEPVRDLLPAGTVAKPSGPEITLVDLATQHSGLPRMPDNFHPKEPENPYADYGPTELYAFVAQHGLAKAPDAGYLYSNLGFGLLGQALADRASVAYPELLKQEVTQPLELRDTAIALSPEQELRFLPGHDSDHHPAHAWDLVALAGAGAIRSTAGDMLSYLEANLHPEKVHAGGPEGASLAAALAASHKLRADAFAGQRIALAWHFDPVTGNYWHNGATGGYSSYAFFNPKNDFAAVVLLNTSIGDKGSFADRVGEHVSQRLAGKPAISLAN